MTKAIITNRIFIETDLELEKELLKNLTYSIEAYRPELAPRVITNARVIKPGLMSIPSGRVDLIPEYFDIIDRRVEVPVEFPEFKFKLRESQQVVYDQINSDAFINAWTSWGKAQPLYSKIRVPEGWVTMGDIKVGDKIVTPNNSIAKVTNKYLHKSKNIYRVFLKDGRSVDCCDEHLWNVIKRTGPQVTINTKELIQLVNNKTRVYLPLPSVPIGDKEKSHLIDPYLLGLLLSDGSISTNSIGFSTSDKFIVDKVQSLLPSKHNVIYSSNYDYYITSEDGNNLITKELRRLSLLGTRSDTKFIPEEYLIDSVSNKLRLLQGLFDGDGDVEKEGYIAYTSTSKELIANIVELINSLGGTANVQTRTTKYSYKGEKLEGKVSYRIRPSKLPLYIKKQLFSLPRKLNRVQPNSLDNTAKVAVEKVEYVGVMDCACIEIDSTDKLYLTDNYIVTHNTFTALAIAGKLSQKTLIIVHTLALREQWAQEVKKVYGIEPSIIGSGKIDMSGPIVIGNVQSLSKMPRQTLEKAFGTIMVDECHHIPSKTFSALIDTSHAKYKIGLSASSRRKDKLHILFSDYFSKKTFTPPRENYITPKIHRVSVPIRLADGAQSWAEKVNDLCYSEDYQKYISLIAASYAAKGHKVLVVAARTQLLERCHEQTPNSVCIIGSTKDRQSNLDKIKNDAKILYGSINIFSEGISINELSCLVLATPLNNEPLLEQLIGRVIRKSSGKLDPIIVDIQLQGKTVSNQANLRKAYYLKQGYDIIDI